MNYKHLFLIVFALFIYSCKQEKISLTKIEGKQININDSLEINQEVEDFVKPYRDHVNKNLDSVISYAVDTYSKSDGDYNTAIGNLFADAVIEESSTLFKKRTGHNVDVVLLNHGGIRAIISKGNITTRTAYEIMPFENSLVVAEMKGKTIQDSLIKYLSRAKRAHPIAGLKVTLDNHGGDRMTFFQTNDSLHVLNYKVRNALLDYFLKKDTINPVIDDRFIQLK